MSAWNKLPQEVVGVRSVGEFKGRLNDVWLFAFEVQCVNCRAGERFDRRLNNIFFIKDDMNESFSHMKDSHFHHGN